MALLFDQINLTVVFSGRAQGSVMHWSEQQSVVAIDMLTIA